MLLQPTGAINRNTGLNPVYACYFYFKYIKFLRKVHMKLLQDVSSWRVKASRHHMLGPFIKSSRIYLKLANTKPVITVFELYEIYSSQDNVIRNSYVFVGVRV